MADQIVPPKKKMGTGAKIAIGCVAFILLGGIITIAIIAAGAAGISKVAEEVDKQQTEQEKQENDAFNNPAKLGETIVVNDVQWIVTEAKNLGSTLKSTYGGEDCVANSGSFVKAVVKIKNNSKQMVSVTDLNLYDSEKREYITSSEVFGCTEDNLFILENINPGIEKTFVAIYEIPEGAKGLRLKVGDLNLFTEGYKYVSLGF